MPFAESIGMSYVWAIPVLSVAAFCLVPLLGRFLPKQGAFISVVGIGLGFGLFWYVLHDFLVSGGESVSYSLSWLSVGDTRITWGVIVDRISVIMIGLITFVALVVQIYSLDYMKGKDEGRIGWYYAAHALFAGAMLALVMADNLIFLYLTWELVGLGSYLLIGFWYEKRAAAEAAKKAFITTRIGDVGLLIGIMLLFKATGTFDIMTLFHIAREGGIAQGTMNAATFLIFLGAMGKSAQFPFHVWLPDAMEGPTPVSALIHAATMVAAGVFLVARMMPIFVLTPDVLLFVSFIGLFTFVFAGTVALVMTDLKRVLAYSTVSHLGLMMLGLGAGSVAAALFHLIAHGVSKALLFLGAGSVTHVTGQTDIRELGGLWKRIPVTAVTFVIGAASLAGIAPLSGFFSKDEVMLAVHDGRGLLFMVPALIGALLSSLYMGRVTLMVFFGKLNSRNRKVQEAPMIIVGCLVLLAIFVIAIGLLVFNWTAYYPGFVEFVEDQGDFHMEPWITVTSTVIALAGVALSWMVFIKKMPSPDTVVARISAIHRVLVGQYYVDDFYQWIINRVVLAVSGTVALFDRVVVNDTGVDGSAAAVMLAGLRLRYIQSGRFYNYGLAMAVGVIVLSLLWWVVLT